METEQAGLAIEISEDPLKMFGWKDSKYKRKKTRVVLEQFLIIGVHWGVRVLTISMEWNKHFSQVFFLRGVLLDIPVQNDM